MSITTGNIMTLGFWVDDPPEAEVKDTTTFSMGKTGSYNPIATSVFPAEADVWHGTGAYGPTGSDLTPAMVGSDIFNLTSENIKLGVVIDDVVGTYFIEGSGASFIEPLVDTSSRIVEREMPARGVEHKIRFANSTPNESFEIEAFQLFTAKADRL